MTPEHRERMLECAMAYISHGWRVIPLCYPVDGACTCGRGCKKPGKAPHYKLAVNGSKDASSDEATVKEWFASSLNFNIGVVAGRESGLVILDVDPATGGDESIKKFPEIHTATVQTGGGGLHYYFRHTGEEIRNSAGTLAGGLDIRGENGYVVAPPSLHVSGQEYRWLVDPRGLQDAPQWLTGHKGRRSPANHPAGHESIPEGKRNDILTSLAGGMRQQGFEEDEIYVALCAINAKRCNPPLPEDEVAVIAKSVCNYTPDENKTIRDKILLRDDHPDTVAEAYEKHSPVAHHYHPFDGWSICKDGRYEKVDDKKQIAKYISRFASQCWFVKNKHKNRIRLSSGRVNDILQQLSFLDGVYLRPSMAAPHSVDGTLDPQNIIACRNCLVEIDTGKTHPITPTFYTFNYLPYDYVSGAISEKWNRFLFDITDHDAELMLLLQMWCGYLLMPTTKYQKFLLCVGDGANGKFVFFDTIAAALGKQNVSNVPLESFAEPYKVFATFGKTVNMSNENAKTLEAAAESIIKEFVGGDKMLWEQKYRDAFSAYPTAKLMFATNILPRIHDPSDGIWRRMLYVPFDVVFPEDKQNKNLAAELQEPGELAGILNWMLEGREALETCGGFIIPQRCKERLQIYRDESNSSRMFISEFLEVDPDNAEPVVKSQLYCTYQKWCKDNGYYAKGAAQFGQDLRRYFPDIQDIRKSFDGSKKTAYIGIRCQEGSELLSAY